MKDPGCDLSGVFGPGTARSHRGMVAQADNQTGGGT
jgi:hypothetical protein